MIGLFLLCTACNHSSADNAAKGKDDKGGKDGKGGKRAGFVATIVQKNSLQSQLHGIGTLQASEQIDIKSEIAGRVKSISFKEGQNIRKGDLLVKIDDAELVAQKAKAQSHFDLLKSTQMRRKQQLDLQAITQQDYEQSVADLAGADADVKLLDAQLAKTEIRAPFAGVLGLRRIGEGQVISAGQAITNLVQTSPLKAELSIPGEQAVFAKPGQTLKIHTVNGEEHVARIYATDGSIDEASRSLVVRAYVEGKGGGLVPGSAIDYEISIPEVEGILVPPESIAGDAQGTIVYLAKGGKAVPARVKLGRRTVDRVQILEGVSPGDTLLCVGATSIRPNMPVDIAEIR